MELKSVYSRLSSSERKILLVVTAFLVIILPYQFFYAMPAKKLGKIKQEADTTRAEIAAINAQVAALRSAVETRKIKPVRDLSVPRSEKLSLLLQEIGKEARVARVDFVSLQPEAIVDKGDFLELTIKMELKVRYRELYEFLDRLEATQQAVRVQELRYETTDALYPFGVAVLSAATYVRKQ